MSENRELTLDDYLAMLRRRLKVILIPALIAPLAGFLVSYAFSPKYTSTATIVVEVQKVPDALVQSVITADFTQRVQTIQEKVMSPARLRPMVQSLALVKPDDEGKLVEYIQQPGSVSVDSVITSLSASAGTKKKPSASSGPQPGLNVSYTDSNAQRAQKICSALTEQFVNENLKSRGELANSTTEFLRGQVEEAKHALDEQDAKLAAFKKQHVGQLPTDRDSNIRELQTLTSQLDATTQALNRAQQDKTYTEGMIAQQIAAWKSSQNTANPQTLEHDLSQLQGQLRLLQSRYTDDYPDVIKAKADIAAVQKKLDEANAAAAAPTKSDGNDKASAGEPPEIRQLRLQAHQYQQVIDQATVAEKRLQSQINVYQSRTTMSPDVEQQYNLLTRDNDNAQSFYKDLLANQSKAELGTSMETKQEGEQMNILVPASLPDSPTFPNRPIFAAAGLGAGLALGLLLAVLMEFSDKSIRTEKDVAAVMDLPLLISVPWLGEEAADGAGGNGYGHLWSRGKPDASKDREKVGV
jgi:uncharacterized protein involved in exopolysaccharide biosynthesis